MKGQIVSHYRILGEIGRGGMGVVYRAEDTKLQRIVALKFLPSELTSDEDAKQRFLREARVASGLDHPNVCSIHEIDETPDGQLFLAMAFYEGETLRNRIGRGPVAINEALDVAVQTAQGLRKAHEAGIVHRDIKPANLFITTDGIVKILDFGIAKLTGQTRLTRTGTTLGTIAYIAPEQIRGAEADERSDLWALGVVLYEMATGQYPFCGDHEAALLHSVLNDTPKPARQVAPAVPAKLEAILTRALAKEPSARYSSAAEFRQALTELDSMVTAHSPVLEKSTGTQFIRRPLFAVPAVIVLLIGLAIGAWAWNRMARAQWAREQAIPEIARLVNQGSYDAAFAMAEKAAPYAADDPMLRTLTPQFAITMSLTTVPPAADVYVRAYEDAKDEWRLLGRTPLVNLKLPRHAFRWRIEKDGFQSTELATTNQVDHLANNSAMEITLQQNGVRPPDMVFVPGGRSTLRLSATVLGPIDLSPVFIDRFEVTNKAYKEFVDAGGYQNHIYWDMLDFRKDGKQLTWDEARTLFVDSTGRPGPSTWELGGYQKGQDDYPVAGVSWYEAMAYANYRKKTLPTVYHWAKAALPDTEMLSSLAASLAPLSNFASSGPAPVGRHQGVGPYGTYDMQGNVREWSWNQGPNGGWLLGGGWSDLEYFYNHAEAVSLFDRSAVNGFRLAQETPPGSIAPELKKPVNLSTQRDVTAAKPASNEVFEVYRRFFSYSPRELNATSPAIVETTDDWTKERVTIDTGYRNERMDVYLFIPKRGREPFQPVVFFPGYNSFQIRRSSNSFDPAQPGYPLDYIIKSGRVLVQPIYQGTYERWNPIDVTDEANYPRKMVDWRWDLGRTLDYLQSRHDIDPSRIGYLGTSFGGSYALPLLVVERRFKAAILISGGLTTQETVPPITDCVNYASRITIPVLMVSGKYDNFFTVKASQEPLFKLLGSPAKDKRYVALESGHASHPRDKLINETLTWLDKYLGPVQ